MIEAIKPSVYYKAPRQLNTKNSSIKDLILEDKTNCPECGSSDLSYDSNRYETFCNNCGYVVDEDIIDRSYNGLSFTNEGSCKTHSGSTKSSILYGGGHFTFISKNSSRLSTSNKESYYRLYNAEKMTFLKDNKERNLATANKELKIIKSQLGLSKSIEEEASKFYRDSLAANLIHGHTIEGMMAACVYLACKNANIPRSSKEISAASGVESKYIIRGSKLIKEKIGMKSVCASPKEFIPRFVSNLDLPKTVEAKAISLIDLLDDKMLGNGTQPTTYAAASIYASCKLLKIKMPQKHIVKATGVSETTIRKQYKVFMN